MKTYEEFNLFEKYNDYIGLDEIDAIDQFNDITGNRDVYLIKKLLDEDCIKCMLEMGCSPIYPYYSIFLKKFNGKWEHIGNFNYSYKTNIGFFQVDYDKKIAFFQLEKLNDEYKDIIINYYKKMKDDDYIWSRKMIKKILTEE